MLQVPLFLCASLAFCPDPGVGCVFSFPVVMISLIWAIALFLCVCCVSYFLHKSDVIKKEMAAEEHKHEQTMKDMAYEQEKYWAKFNGVSAQAAELLKNQIEKMDQSISTLINELNHQKEMNELTSKTVSYCQECVEKLKEQIVGDNKEQ